MARKETTYDEAQIAEREVEGKDVEDSARIVVEQAERMTALIRFGADCLAGIPSIIFGLFGFVFFVIYLKLGWSMLSGGLTLAIMVLPIGPAEKAPLPSRSYCPE